MAISVYSLGSGSKGNCVLADNGKTRILIDAGLKANIICTKLAELNLSLSDINGVLITHEHDDHIKGVAELADFTDIYSHGETLEYIADKYSVPSKSLMEIDETAFGIGTMDILPFRISHDALHPLGYCLSDWESKFTYLTDTGYISKGMFSIAEGSDTVMLESNHDIELLKKGTYPLYLKKRILSDIGHLSNDESALTAYDLVERGAKKIMLAHISEQNNLPELAYWTVTNYLRQKGVETGDCCVKVAAQRATVIL